jgi:uncharacterized surface protein with fasciclin (FAS1) repeats
MSSQLVGRRWLWTLPLAVLALAGPTFVAVAADATPAGEPNTIVDALKAAGHFKTLVQLLESSGLAKDLGEKGPYTLFAPTDEAFAKLPKATLDDLSKPENKDKLLRVLKFHVVTGKHLAADVEKMKKAKTLQGSEVTIEFKSGKLHVGGALVTKSDTLAGNGVIHTIDTVLMPKEHASGGHMSTPAGGTHNHGNNHSSGPHATGGAGLHY